MKLLMIKGYYGVNIHGDGHGDLGCTVYDGNINPDIVFIMAATIAHNSEDIELEVIDAVAEELLADEMLKELERKEKEYNSIWSWRRNLKKYFLKLMCLFLGILQSYCGNG